MGNPHRSNRFCTKWFLPCFYHLGGLDTPNKRHLFPPPKKCQCLSLSAAPGPERGPKVWHWWSLMGWLSTPFVAFQLSTPSFIPMGDHFYWSGKPKASYHARSLGFSEIGSIPQIASNSLPVFTAVASTQKKTRVEHGWIESCWSSNETIIHWWFYCFKDLQSPFLEVS